MSTSFELAGTVRHILDLQTFNSGFTKREFVVEVQDGQYSQMIKFECLKDKTALLDDLSVGDDVNVSFNIRGNEFKDRFYVNLVAWKISKGEGASGNESGGSASSGDSNSSLEASLDNEPDESDDIPF